MSSELTDFVYGILGLGVGLTGGGYLVALTINAVLSVAGAIAGFTTDRNQLLRRAQKQKGQLVPLVPAEVKPVMDAELVEQVATKPSDYRLDKATSRFLASLAKALLVAEKNGAENGRGEEFRRAQTLRKRLVDNVDAWRETVRYEGRNKTNYAIFLSNLNLIAEQLGEHNRNYRRAGNRQLRTLNSYLTKKVEESVAKTIV